MPISENNSGVFTACDLDTRIFQIESRLQLSGADTLTLATNGVILAVWKLFEGQGLWSEPEGAVAYDVDLTNKKELLKLADGSGDMDPGNMIWLLYRRLGLDFIDRLRGAFSFSIWDAQKRRMLVVTDPYGIKPIVYAFNGRGFLAASRIRYLQNDDGIDTATDPEAVYHYLFFQAICSPKTIYREISKLAPGQALLCREKRLKRFTYYDIRYHPRKPADEEYWKTRIREEVRNAVGRFSSLETPDRTGCYLSGGTDSSSVAGYYTQLTGLPAKTFSIGFDEPAYNELGYAHIAARHFGTIQHDYYVTPDDVLQLLEALPNLYDEPFGNSSVVPAYYCAKLAKERGVDVLLAGDGGDEIFGGNERYVDNLVFALYSRFPKSLRQKVFEPIISHMPDQSLMYKAKRYVRRANFPNPDRFFSYNLLAELDADIIFRQNFLESLDTECFIRLARRLYRDAAPAHDTDRLLYIDMKFTITDNDLRKVTRMAEVAGIKVLYPLLDRDLVDFTATIPPTLKVKWKKNRYIFKKAMENFLPLQIIKKSKHGMGLPIATWFRKDRRLYELLSEILFCTNPKISQWVRPDFIEKLHHEFLADPKTPYYGSYLWVFLMLELWLRSRKND